MKISIGKKFKWKIYYCVLFFFLLKPDYFSFLGVFTVVYNMGFIITLNYVLFSEFRNLKIKKLTLIVYSIVLFPLLVAALKGVELSQSVLIPVFQTIGLVAVIDKGMKTKASETLSGLALLLEIYIYINFISILLCPNGLYEAELYSGNYWFLGYKNVMVRFLIPAIVINAICTVYKKGQYNIRLFVLIVISVMTEWMVDCKTGLLGIGIVAIAMLIFSRRKLPKCFNAKNGMIVVGVLSVALGTTAMLNNFSGILQDLGEKASVFSRQAVWFRAIQLFLKSPIFGYGVRTNDGYRQLINLSTGWGYFSHPHNYILYVLIQGGLVEICLIGNLMTKVSKMCLKNRENYTAKMLLVYYIAFFVMGITESLSGCTLLFPIALLAYNLSRLDIKYK